MRFILCAFALLMAFIAQVGCGSAGSEGNSDSSQASFNNCVFNLTSFENKPYYCEDSGMFHKMTFTLYSNGSGASDYLGDFQWHQTSCDSVSISNNANTLEITNLYSQNGTFLSFTTDFQGAVNSWNCVPLLQ